MVAFSASNCLSRLANASRSCTAMLVSAFLIKPPLGWSDRVSVAGNTQHRRGSGRMRCWSARSATRRPGNAPDGAATTTGPDPAAGRADAPRCGCWLLWRPPGRRGTGPSGHPARAAARGPQRRPGRWRIACRRHDASWPGSGSGRGARGPAGCAGRCRISSHVSIGAKRGCSSVMAEAQQRRRGHANRPPSFQGCQIEAECRMVLFPEAASIQLGLQARPRGGLSAFYGAGFQQSPRIDRVSAACALPFHAVARRASGMKLRGMSSAVRDDDRRTSRPTQNR